MRMPRYNMSSREASQLVDYFAAKDEAIYPYELESARQADHLAAADDRYAQTLERLADEDALQLDEPPRNRHLADAMNVVTNGNYCVKCHLIGDYNPPGTDRVKAPDLSRVHKRLRGDYLRKWLAKPTSIQPYTSMPVNIPFDRGRAVDGNHRSSAAVSRNECRATRRVGGSVDELRSLQQ